MAYMLNVDVFEWNHPCMEETLSVTIGFETISRYDSISGEREEICPYVEAVYLGNTDIMPLMMPQDLRQILKDYSKEN